MVKKQFISKQETGANLWRWPVFAKSESEFENFLTSIAPFMVLPIIFPAGSALFLLGFWVLYHYKFLEFRTLKIMATLSGSLWFAFGYIFGINSVLYEIFCSSFYRMPEHSYLELTILYTSRQIFFITGAMIFWIFYNRRIVHPDKVHHKVYSRQKHERIRLMRIWHKTIQLPEVLYK